MSCTVSQYLHEATFSGSQIGSCGSVLRHYFTYQGQTYSDDFVDIQSHESVGDMQMFFVFFDGEGGYFPSQCIQHALYNFT